MRDNESLDSEVAARIFGVDVTPHPEHLWERNSSGNVNEFAMEADNHNGPMCERCGYSYCQHCEDPKEAEREELPCVNWRPAYSSSIEAAFSIVAHIRENWLFSKRQAFTAALQATVSKRKNCDGFVLAHSEVILHVQPEDICLAALEALDYVPSATSAET